MSTKSMKRRGSYALLTLIAAFGLAILGAGSASAVSTVEDPGVVHFTLSCVKQGENTVVITTTIDSGVSGADRAVIWINDQERTDLTVGIPGSATITVNAGDSVSMYVGKPGYFVAGHTVKECEKPSPEPTPTPTPTPEPTPEPSPEPTPERSPEPVTSTVPGTTRTVVVSPAPVVKNVVPPATAGGNGVTDEGSWALVVLGLGLLLVWGMIKYRRPHAGRRH